jgi:methylmalonyl-CoA/ethylmalonyl-CoA epimerase
MKKKLVHVGVAVSDLSAAVATFQRLLGLSDVPTETVADQRVRLAFFHTEGASIELTEPTSPDSPIAKFIAKRGEGVHHLSFEVEDIRAELARLKADGFQLVDEEPRRGAGGYWIAFVHPKSTHGVLIEISQKIAPEGAPR